MTKTEIIFDKEQQREEFFEILRKEQVILTGSSALAMYGMMHHRPVEDIDIVFPTQFAMTNFCNKHLLMFNEYNVKPEKSSYIENFFRLTSQRLPMLKIDCFIKSDIKSVFVNGMYVEHHRGILAAKLAILCDRLNLNIKDEVYCKHMNDLLNIFPH